MGRKLEALLDIAAVGVTAAVVIVAAGRLINSQTAHRLDSVPVVGDIVAGVRAAVDQIYDPVGA